MITIATGIALEGIGRVGRVVNYSLANFLVRFFFRVVKVSESLTIGNYRGLSLDAGL